ncbi:MAG: TRAP transporter substrate-binding protein [Peptoniphilaceae bacterium]
MKNKFLNIILIISMFAIFVTACGKKENVSNDNGNKAQSNNDSITIKIGHVEPEDRSTHKALVKFKENVEEKSEGTLTIEIYPNGSLGGDVQLTESVSMGTLDIALPSTSVLTAYTEEFGILDMPYIFKNTDSAFAALDGDVGKYFNEKLKEQGINNLGYSYNGPRSTTTSSRPIEKPEDLKGIKMRVMESPIFIDFYKTLGANPTPMSFTELYTGLQQGTVDAQENPPSLILSNKFYEVQKYLSVDEHVHNFLAVIMNQQKFDSLNQDQQKIIIEESKKFVDNQRTMELEDNEEAITKLGEEGGLIVNRLNDNQKEEFAKALKPMYEKYETSFGKDLFEMCEKYN